MCVCVYIFYIYIYIYIILPSYFIQVSLGMEKSGEDLCMEFPLDVATVPFRISNSPGPELTYGNQSHVYIQLPIASDQY